MKIGVSIVTCDRLFFLIKCILSLGDTFDELVVVDNGSERGVSAITSKYGYDLIYGGKSNSPHGQNLGLHHLAAKGCDVILKSDDDVRYEEGYIKTLLKTWGGHFNEVAAICGTCWSEQHPEIIHRGPDGWYSESGGKVSGECIILDRMKIPVQLEMRHLHGSFLYRVSDALELEKRTLLFGRRGAFPEYLGPVAFREETEFTMCLRQILKKKLVYDSRAVCFHYYAPGGIRRFDMVKEEKKDEEKVRQMLRTLNLDGTLSPADCGSFQV